MGHRRALGKLKAIKMVTPSWSPLAAAAHGSSWEVVLWSKLGGTAVSGSFSLLGLHSAFSHDSVGTLVLVSWPSLLLLTALTGSLSLSVGSLDLLMKMVESGGLVDDGGDVLDAVDVTVGLGNLGTWIRVLALEGLVCG